MPKGSHAERIKKGKFDAAGGSSSGTASGRALRPRRPKRASEQEIEEVDVVENSTDEDEVEDETFRVDYRRDNLGGDNVDEEMAAGDYEEEEAGDDDSAGANAPLTLEICRPTGPASRRVTDYLAGGMTDTVRRLRRTSPLEVDKTATDYRFWTLFQ